MWVLLPCLRCFFTWYGFFAIIYTLFLWQMFSCGNSCHAHWLFDFCIPCKLCGNFIVKYTANFVHTWTTTFLSTTPTHNQAFYVILIFFVPLMFFMWTLLLISFTFKCRSCSPCSRSLHHMTNMTSVVTIMRSILTWRTNALRCLIQCVRQLMQTLLRMLNSSSTTSKRHGTVTTNTQRSRSDISRLSTWQLRSKGTRNFLPPSSMCHLHQSNPSFCCYIWIEVYHCYVCPFLRVHLTLFIVQDGLWLSHVGILCKVGR